MINDELQAVRSLLQQANSDSASKDVELKKLMGRITRASEYLTHMKSDRELTSTERAMIEMTLHYLRGEDT